MNDRLKLLRKTLDLKQDELGNMIKFSRSHVSSLENGTREFTDRIINDICRELNVNEEWFRTGKGEMFIESDSSIIAELANEYKLDELDQLIIEHYVKLDENSRRVLKEEVISIAKKITSLEETAATYDVDSEIDAEVESYRNELVAEKKIQTYSASRKPGIG